MIFHPVPAAAELAEGRSVAADIDGRPILLVRRGETVYALDNICPHSGARLDKGRVLHDAVVCPLHGARFDFTTGRCRTGQFSDLQPIVTHTVRIADGTIEVALSSRPLIVPQT